jgi:3-mercaptopyruvate sulfurtransferase SseA
VKRFEALVYAAVLAVLSLMLVAEGRRATKLAAQQAIAPKALYAQLSNPKVQLQVVDLRDYDDDHFLDAHIPGAIPFPGCDLSRAPGRARDRAYPYVATVLVTESGDPSALAACASHFGQVRLLAGGMDAWSNANLPEDTGDYVPPKAGGGGGCL